MEKISVIVPIYKVEEYLDNCIKSIVNQTYSNLEIILVDDGSPDGCPAVCDAWAQKDSRIKVIHKKNGGLSDARNAGMGIASGEYIAFVDSDDWVAEDFIQALYDALLRSGSDIAACDIRLVSSAEDIPACRGGEITCRICGPEEAIGDIVSGKGFQAVAWNKLYKRSVLENERYPVGKHHEDEFFTYRILGKAEKLVFLEKELYYYFQRPGSIMQSASVKRLDALDAYLERLEYLQKRFPKLYAIDKVNFCASCVGFYRQFLKQGGSQRREGVRRIRRCRRQVKFSTAEIRQCNLKQVLYILCSRYAIGAFSRVLNRKERGN